MRTRRRFFACRRMQIEIFSDLNSHEKQANSRFLRIPSNPALQISTNPLFLQ
ncbi:hypothetical protein HanIR_Chr08g0348411 [Helianthus annuus]|nr:hypothetical protein HanIR_Chr08g0348411 [Helianthus annuus]